MNKKLLFFASDYQIGLSAVLTDQLIALGKSGTNVYSVAGENEQEPGLELAIRKQNVGFERIKGLDTHSDFFRLASNIKRIVLREGVDIVHVQNNWQLALVYAVKNALRFKRKIEIVYTIHGFRNNHHIKAKVAQLVIGTALFITVDHVICMTEYLKNKFRLLTYKICMIPLGIKDDFFTDQYFPPRTDALHLIFPAQFRVGKNQDLIIRAFKEYVNRTGDNFSTLTLPGGGDLLENLKILTKDLGIEKQVRFPGLLPKEDVRRLYLESNVAIVASNSETFGQSIVEPYVLGRCIVSTPVGIASEIIAHGENGYIFHNETELTEVLMELSHASEKLIEIGDNNYKQRLQFTWGNITNRYIKTLGLN